MYKKLRSRCTNKHKIFSICETVAAQVEKEKPVVMAPTDPSKKLMPRPDSLGANGPQATILRQEHQLGAKCIGLEWFISKTWTQDYYSYWFYTVLWFYTR